MHPIIDRVHRIRREMAQELWKPDAIVLGWATHDLLAPDLARTEAYAGPSHPRAFRILGFEVHRDDRVPIGGKIRFSRDTYRSAYERHTEYTTVAL